MDLRVVGPRLFYMVSPPQKIPPNPGGFLEQPRSLKAVDLKTGKVIWESPLEPTRHLPPVP